MEKSKLEDPRNIEEQITTLNQLVRQTLYRLRDTNSYLTSQEKKQLEDVNNKVEAQVEQAELPSPRKIGRSEQEHVEQSAIHS